MPSGMDNDLKCSCVALICRGNPCGCPASRAGARPAPTMLILEMRMLIRLSNIIIILSLVLSGVAQGQEDMSDDPAEALVREKSELKGLQQKIEDERDQLKEAREKEKKVVSELNRIEKDLAVKKKSLREYNAKLKEKRKEIKALSKEIDALQKTANQQEAHLGRYAEDLYKLSRADLIKAVFAAQSFSDLLRHHEYLTRIIDYNATVIDSYAENIGKIENDRDRLRQSETRLTELTEKERSTQKQVLAPQTRKKDASCTGKDGKRSPSEFDRRVRRGFATAPSADRNAGKEFQYNHRYTTKTVFCVQKQVHFSGGW